jgi:hypothetical protein
MLTELIAAAQKTTENGNGNGDEPPPRRTRSSRRRARTGARGRGSSLESLPIEQDPGAIRRYRFRHPTASGKTIAASGFVEVVFAPKASDPHPPPPARRPVPAS